MIHQEKEREKMSIVSMPSNSLTYGKTDSIGTGVVDSSIESDGASIMIMSSDAVSQKKEQLLDERTGMWQILFIVTEKMLALKEPLFAW